MNSKPGLRLLDLTRFLPQISLRNLRKLSCPQTGLLGSSPRHASLENALAIPPGRPARSAYRQREKPRTAAHRRHQIRKKSGRLQQRLANQIRGVAGAKLAHRLGAMALEVLGLIFIRKAPCLLEQPSLIRLSTSRSRLVSGFGRSPGRTSVPACGRHPQGGGPEPRLPACRRIGGRRRMIVRHLLHQGADALGLLKRILHHLLQVEPVAGRLRKLVAVLLDLIHVEQQSRQRPVELPGNRSARLFRGTRARPDSWTISGFSSRGAMFSIHFVKCKSAARWSCPDI